MLDQIYFFISHWLQLNKTFSFLVWIFWWRLRFLLLSALCSHWSHGKRILTLFFQHFNLWISFELYCNWRPPFVVVEILVAHYVFLTEPTWKDSLISYIKMAMVFVNSRTRTSTLANDHANHKAGSQLKITPNDLSHSSYYGHEAQITIWIS